MSSTLAKHFSSSSAAKHRSAIIDAQLATELPVLRSTARIIVLGPTGSGKSALLKLLCAVSAPRVVQHDARDRVADEEDGRSTVSSVTLTPSQGHEASQQDDEVPKQPKQDDSYLASPAASAISEVLLREPGGLRLRFTEVPSTLSRKVMHQFEHGTCAIIYPIDLSSYADTIPEPGTAETLKWAHHPAGAAPTTVPANQLQASLDVLESLIRSRLLYWRGSAFITVMFTNADRLAAKLRLFPFKDVFPAFDSEETVQGVAEYVVNLLVYINVRNGDFASSIRYVYPAVLNLAEEDDAKRAMTRAGIISFLTNTILSANLRTISCFGSSSIAEDKQEMSKVILEEVARGAPDGAILKQWDLW